MSEQRRGLSLMRALTFNGCIAPLLLACSSELEPCYGLAVGERYNIELIEVYDESSSFEFQMNPGPETCGREFDLQEGDVLEVHVVEQIRWDFCKHNVVELESQQPWELGGPGVAFSTGAGDVVSIMRGFCRSA